MVVELFRLLLGVAIALFHRQLAVTILAQEHALYVFLRSRGIHAPAPLSEAATYNLFFGIGIVISVVQAARIWLFL